MSKIPITHADSLVDLVGEAAPFSASFVRPDQRASVMKSKNKPTKRNLKRPKTDLACPRRGAHFLANGCDAETFANTSGGDPGAKIAQLTFRFNNTYIVDTIVHRPRSKIFIEKKTLRKDQELDIDSWHQLRTTRQQS